MTTISEFTAVLRDQLGTTERALVAKEAAQPRELYRHSARVLDLMDRASRNGVETTGWGWKGGMGTRTAHRHLWPLTRR